MLSVGRLDLKRTIPANLPAGRGTRREENPDSPGEWLQQDRDGALVADWLTPYPSPGHKRDAREALGADISGGARPW